MDRDYERQELQDKVAKCYRLAREFPDGITNKNLLDLAAELGSVEIHLEWMTAVAR